MLVVLCYIESGGEILLLKRRKEPYAGYLALPGGKVEAEEGVLAAACREVLEETGLNALRAEVRGRASEVIRDEISGSILYEYDMVLVQVYTENLRVRESEEGELFRMKMDNFFTSDRVVPTDIDIVRRYVIHGGISVPRYSVMRSKSGVYQIAKLEC